MTKELDRKDWRILYHLCTDSRASHSQIGRAVQLSKNAVTYRIDRMIKRNIISGFFSLVDYGLLGISTYVVLLRLKGSTEEERELIKYLVSSPNVMVVDRLLGEWNIIMELGCKKAQDLIGFLMELKAKHSGVIDTYEIHSLLGMYKVEQLPVELAGETPIGRHQRTKQFKGVDRTDRRLLYELNRNSATALSELGERLGMTYETVSARIKKLREGGVVLKLTAKIDMIALGYDVYLILLDIRNFSKERELALANYIKSQKAVRYSFLSAYRPAVFIYLAAKKSADLNSFLLSIKEKFSDIIISQRYLLSTEQLKYELFPEGFI